MINERREPDVLPWGKLSVDDGADSDRLSPRDVADVTVLAAIAGASLADKLRSTLHRELAVQREAHAGLAEPLLKIYEKYAHELDTAEWRQPDVRILPHVRKLLLRLYLELFGLEAAFFREYIPESRVLRKKELEHEEGCPPTVRSHRRDPGRGLPEL